MTRPTCRTCRFWVRYKKIHTSLGKCLYYVPDVATVTVTPYVPGIPSDILDMRGFPVCKTGQRCPNHLTRETTP